MQDMTTRIVPIEPQWFMQKAEVQSRTWRELNQGHIPQDIVDAITPAFALKLTRGHATDPNQVVLIALADDRVVGFAERTTPSVSGNGMAACSSAVKVLAAFFVAIFVRGANATAIRIALVFGVVLYAVFTFAWTPLHYLHLMFITFVATVARLSCSVPEWLGSR